MTVLAVRQLFLGFPPVVCDLFFSSWRIIRDSLTPIRANLQTNLIHSLS
jgi:hypothetical protein